MLNYLRRTILNIRSISMKKNIVLIGIVSFLFGILVGLLLYHILWYFYLSKGYPDNIIMKYVPKKQLSRDYAQDIFGNLYHGCYDMGVSDSNVLSRPDDCPECNYLRIIYYCNIINKEDEYDLFAVDVESFEIIEKSPYARDKDHVYISGRADVYIVKEADPKTFQVLENGYAKDAQNVFYEKKSIPADVKSFTKKDISSYTFREDCLTCPSTEEMLYGDDTNLFYKGKLIEKEYYTKSQNN